MPASNMQEHPEEKEPAPCQKEVRIRLISYTSSYLLLTGSEADLEYLLDLGEKPGNIILVSGVKR